MSDVSVPSAQIFLHQVKQSDKMSPFQHGMEIVKSCISINSSGILLVLLGSDIRELGRAKLSVQSHLKSLGISHVYTGFDYMLYKRGREICRLVFLMPSEERLMEWYGRAVIIIDPQQWEEHALFLPFCNDTAKKGRSSMAFSYREGSEPLWFWDFLGNFKDRAHWIIHETHWQI